MGYSVFITIVAIILFLLGLGMFLKGNFYYKILVILGLKERKQKTNWALIAWENCLNKLNFKADIVFFGDSITRGSNFGKFFDKKIVNLGLAGDTLDGMLKRVSLIKAVSPEKLFVLGGINGLKDININVCEEKYEKLLKEIRQEVPKTQIYVLSVLPISSKQEITLLCHNTAIEKFNERIEKLSKSYDAKYINLFQLFSENGKINPDLTVDGIHINEKGYSVWADAIKEYV